MLFLVAACWRSGDRDNPAGCVVTKLGHGGGLLPGGVVLPARCVLLSGGDKMSGGPRAMGSLGFAVPSSVEKLTRS